MFRQIGTFTENKLSQSDQENLKCYLDNTQNAENTAVYHSDDGRIWWTVILDLTDVEQLEDELILGGEKLQTAADLSKELKDRLEKIGCVFHPTPFDDNVWDT